MTRTEMYFQTVVNYRAQLRAIWRVYEDAEKRLAPYKDSAGYASELAEAAKERDASITMAQNTAAKEFSDVLRWMREGAMNKPMAAPKAEQINLLSALKMRDKVTRDELQQAANSLKDCPVALSVLDELATKNEFFGLHFGAESTAAVMQHIDSLEASAKKICNLQKPDSRREMLSNANVHNTNYTPNAMRSFAVDRDFESAQDCIAFCGSVGNYEAFAEAVNE